MIKTKENADYGIVIEELDAVQPSHSEMLPWAITTGEGETVRQIVATKDTVEWLNERLTTLAYLQGAHRRGGQVTSAAKRAASIENGKKHLSREKLEQKFGEVQAEKASRYRDYNENSMDPYDIAERNVIKRLSEDFYETS